MEDSDADSEMLQISKKRKSAVIETSSEEDGDDNCVTKTPDQKVNFEGQESLSTRSSARIAKRQSRSFEMPSRDSVWEKIIPTKDADKYHLLTPRKLVNNFTKENSRYNFDPNYTSGEESLDAFIIDSDVSPDTDSSIADTKTTKKRGNTRVKNRKERIVLASSSDSESEADNRSTGLESFKTVDENLKTPFVQNCDSNSKTSSEDSQSNESGFEEGVNKNNKPDENEDEDMFLTPCHKKCKSNVIGSDSESDSQEDIKPEAGEITGNQESNTTVCSIKPAKPLSLSCSYTESPSCSRKRSGSNSSGPENETEIAGAEEEAKESSSETSDSRSNDETDSNSDSDDESDSDSGDGQDSQSTDTDLENVTSRTRVQMVKKKKEKLKLFEKFRQARERKLKKEKKSSSTNQGC